MLHVRRFDRLTALFFLSFHLLAAGVASQAQNSNEPRSQEQMEEQFEKGDHGDYMRQRQEWFYGKRAYPGKKIPAGIRDRAFKQRAVKLRAEAKARASLGGLGADGVKANVTPPSWTLIGPQPLNGFWGANAGRITALAINPTNPNIVYAGGAEGGVWQSSDGGNTWTPLSDFEPSLAVGSIAIDPTSPNNIYVGTGEENYSGDSYFGSGVLKSTDGGKTWTQYASTFTGGVCGGAWIGGMAVNPSNNQVVLAGVAQCFADGAYRSANGGQTWTQALFPPGGGPVTTVLFDPTNGNVAYAASNGHGIYKSTDAGQTWTASNGSGTTALPGSGVGRVALAMAPSNTSTLFVGIANSSSGQLLGLYQSTDGGASWRQLTNTPNYCGGQCWYDNAIAVSPVDANVIYAGGDGNAVWRSLDGGNTWTQQPGVHPDSHAFVFTPDGTVLFNGNDGGVWKTTAPTAQTVSWTNLNETLALTEFYPGISIDPNNVNHTYIGTQDNSTERYSGSTTWQSVDCGDGGPTAIDFTNPNTIYVNCVGLSLDKSVNDGVSFSSATTGINSDRTAWVPPLAMDPGNSQTLYFGTYRVYQTTNGAGMWAPISPDLTSGGTLNAIAVAPTDSNTVYTGSGDGQVFVSRNAVSGTAATWTNVTSSTSLPPRSIDWIAVDPTNATTAYLVYSGFTGYGDSLGHVFKTTNAGATWQDISADLPNTPVNAILVDPDSPSTIFIGTDIGVFYTTSSGTSWSTFGTGLPTVVVTGLGLHNGTRTLRASTHGRSVWDINIATVLSVPSITSISPNNAQLAGAAFTLTVDGVQFDSSCVVEWNGAALTTTFVNSGQLTATVPANDLLAEGSASITVLSVSSAKLSNAADFSIDNPVPTAISLSPNTVTAQGAAFPLTVNGSNFVNGATVLWSGAARTTTFVNATQLTASISASDIGLSGSVSVSVANPPLGGGDSGALSLAIVNPVPVLTGISPSGATEGGSNFTLTASGSGFAPGAVIHWNGAPLTTTYVNSTRLTATIAALLIPTAGTASVSVTNPAPGGGASGTATFTISNPGPRLTSLSPSSGIAGSAGFTLTVNGSSFVPASVVDWNGSARATTYVSSTILQATVLASDLAVGGSPRVTVTNPAPGGGGSSALTFTVNDPVPGVTSLSPANAIAGSGAFTLTVTGTGFLSTSRVYWNEVKVTTTFVSATQISASVPASDIGTAGTASVTVVNPTPAGGTSASKTFTIDNPLPAVTSLNPASVIVGSPAFSLKVYGSNFVATSVVKWNGSARTTTFVGPTELHAAILASDISSTGSATVSVTNAAPGGGTSSPGVILAVNNPVPALSAISPASAIAGGAAFTLTATGKNFNAASRIYWNTTELSTTLISATQVSATISTGEIAAAGTASLTVVNPAPGGGTSVALMFTVNNPLPIVTTLSPASGIVGGPAFTLTVNGSNFVATSVVGWNYSARATTYVSSTVLHAAILASDISSTGSATVSVRNPSPGGGTSTAVASFAINNPVPALNAISPASATAGGAAFTLTATGANFNAASRVYWNTTKLSTTFVSSTEMTASVPASDIGTAGSAGVTVVNPTPAGGTSASKTFTINNPLPAVTSLNPASVTVGSPAFSLKVYGSNFVSTSVVHWNGSARATTFVGPTELYGAILAPDISSTGSATVSVTSPTPGGGTSTPGVTIAVNNPVPKLSAISPASAAAGGAAFTLTATGTNFNAASRIYWNTTELSTTLISATQVSATITTGEIAKAGTASVTVVNPVPGGGPSSANMFTINNPLPTVSR